MVKYKDEYEKFKYKKIYNFSNLINEKKSVGYINSFA